MRAVPLLATALPLQGICLLCTDILFSMTAGVDQFILEHRSNISTHTLNHYEGRDTNAANRQHTQYIQHCPRQPTRPLPSFSGLHREPVAPDCKSDARTILDRTSFVMSAQVADTSVSDEPTQTAAYIAPFLSLTPPRRSRSGFFQLEFQFANAFILLAIAAA
jgi:hypothetical protein